MVRFEGLDIVYMPSHDVAADVTWCPSRDAIRHAEGLVLGDAVMTAMSTHL